MLIQALLPAVILLIGALIITGAFVMTSNAGAEMERRIGLVAAPAQGKSAAALANMGMKRQVPLLDLRMRQFFAAGAKFSWGMRAKGGKLLLISAISGIATAVFVARAVSLPGWVAIAIGGLAAYSVPRSLLKRQQRGAESRFMDLFPDAVDTIVRMLRAGLPMTSAVRVVGVEGAPPVNAVFNMIADQVKIGIPIEQALDAGSRHIGLADFRFFTVAVLLQYSAGGNIAATLEMLSGIMRKRRAVRMKARSATAEIRLTGYLLGSLPFFTIGILLLLQPGYLDPLFADRRGHIILAMAGGGLLLSFITMRQMMRSVTNG
jgi:tight adherence protein B